jgi:MFS family permease
MCEASGARSTLSSSLRRLVRHAVVDLGPLRRHRDFRVLFAAQLVTVFGSQITLVALPFQLYALTRSTLAVGLLGLAELVPLLGLAFLGGALADARDRRAMILLTELVFAVMSGLLALNALTQRPLVWPLFTIGAVRAGLYAVQRPSLDALLPRLVPREEMVAASALSTLRGTLSMVAGPALAGVLIAQFGLGFSYALDVTTSIVALLLLAVMRPAPPPPGAAAPSFGRVMEGLRYAWGRQELMGTYLVDMAAMFFGMPMALFPALAERFGGPAVLGLLFAAPAAGSLLASLTSGWASRVHRHGMAIVVAAAGWGVAIVGAGLAPDLPLLLALLALAGGADVISGIFRMTVWNQTIPDALRGRLAGIELVSYASGPLLGNVESGVAAALIGVEGAIVSGGVLCVVAVLGLGAGLPRFRRYDDRRAPALQAASPSG